MRPKVHPEQGEPRAAERTTACMQREYGRRGAVKGQLGSGAWSSDTDIDLHSSSYAIHSYIYRGLCAIPCHRRTISQLAGLSHRLEPGSAATAVVG